MLGESSEVLARFLIAAGAVSGGALEATIPPSRTYLRLSRPDGSTWAYLESDATTESERVRFVVKETDPSIEWARGIAERLRTGAKRVDAEVVSVRSAPGNTRLEVHVPDASAVDRLAAELGGLWETRW
jgi:hypothetical protein